MVLFPFDFVSYHFFLLIYHFKAMARFFLLLALCVLPALVTAKLVSKPFHVQGCVYCDTCRCGFETNKTTYIAGAVIRIECKDRTTLRLKYSVDGQTDQSGKFNIIVEDDHEDDICQAVIVSSPQPDCKIADPRRNRAEVVLTRYNGDVSHVHHANCMGFLKDKALPGCAELVKELLTADE